MARSDYLPTLNDRRELADDMLVARLADRTLLPAPVW
jgi:hypothetical protein